MTRQIRTTALLRPESPTRVRMTYQEFLEAEFENPHVEWVDGDVVMMAPVSGEHSDVGLFLLRAVGGFVEARALGVLRYEPFNMKTGPDLPGRSPDILFVSNKNLSRLKKTYLKGPADLVIEIVSPGSRGNDRGDKFYEYEKGGVKEYWLIDPEREWAEFYVLGRDKRFRLVEHDDDGTFRSHVLQGLALEVGWLWQRPLPKVKDVLKQWGVD